ncbi:hypothetical protein MKJ01_15075 [Chryseobacterium sp. SSA4.19]|uniref:hypothetical protein n=1 Tax=Chryseobacterium sp. SSA4.19 TaxID=2919915 RepID=UPI001F4EF22B|nr:hypothetical protein [Chryseobacterium sp. SSA4.19]MCJ8155089.1 hypothetical protein [Chryseobacterium sp. SSA4.19]
MKSSTLVLALLFQFISLTVFSQKNAGLGSLLNKNSEFIFPQTTESISSVLKEEPDFYEDANEEKYVRWVTPSGLQLYCSLDASKNINEMFFTIPDDKFVILQGLPYKLTMNKTTLQECVAKFRSYGAKTQKLGEDTEYSGGSKLTFKKESRYTVLLFDHKNLLKAMQLVTQLIDPAVN